MTSRQGRTRLRSALGYAGCSVASSLTFLAVARWVGEAPAFAIWGGTVWVLVLSMIVSMPLVTGWMGRRSADRGAGRRRSS